MSFRYNPLTGEFDYFNTQTSAADAAKLIITKVCSVDINILQAVTLITSTDIKVAEIDTYANAKVSGIALESGLTGARIRVLTFGVLEHPSFSFILKDPLFLNSLGVIGASPPFAVGQYVTNIGESLGSGAIFVNTNNPKVIL